MSNNILIFLIFILNFLFPFILSFIFISMLKTWKIKRCSNDIKRKYVKYYGYFFNYISLSIIVPLLYIKYPILVNINDYLKLITLVVNLRICLYEYSEYLENNDCKCSESWKKVFIKYYSYFLIFTMSIIFFCILMIFIAHILYQEDKYIYGVKNLLKNFKI